MAGALAVQHNSILLHLRTSKLSNAPGSTSFRRSASHPVPRLQCRVRRAPNPALNIICQLSRRYTGGDASPESSSNVQPESEETSTNITGSAVPQQAVLVCYVAAASVVTLFGGAASAQADGRRHNRQREDRLREENAKESEDEVTISIPTPQGIQKKVSKAASDAKKQISKTTKAVKKKFKEVTGLGGWSQSAYNTPSASNTVIMGSGSRGFTVAGYQAPRGTWVVAGWAMLAAALYVVWRYVFAPQGTRKKKGRVIYDRSLGGKLVELPEDGAEAGPSQTRPDAPAARRWKRSSEMPRPPAGPSPLDDPVSKSEKDLLPGSPGRVAGAESSTEDAVPGWWQAPPPVYVPPSMIEARKKIPAGFFKELERLRLGGRDYTAGDLLQLHTLCRENGALHIPQETIRSAVYRSAVEAALDAASSGTTSFGEGTPVTFVCGLADDIGVGAAKGGRLVTAGLAARLRGVLLDASAQRLRGEDLGATLDLQRGLRCLRAFPPPPQDPAIAMLAEGIAKRINEEGRLELLKLFVYAGARDEPSMEDLVRECLDLQGAAMPEL